MLFAVLAITAIAAVGCGGKSEPIENVAATATPGMSTSDMGTGTPGTASPTGGIADIERVGAVALRAVPDSTLVSMKAEDGGKAWRVLVVTADGVVHRMTVNAVSAKVTSGPEAKRENAKEKAELQKLIKKAKIDYVEAAQKILSDVPGRITELRLQSDKGVAVWMAEVMDQHGTMHRVKLNAETGQLLATPSGTTSPSGSMSPGGSMSPSPSES
jgi:uncharacterized membrane protein YkoI